MHKRNLFLLPIALLLGLALFFSCDNDDDDGGSSGGTTAADTTAPTAALGTVYSAVTGNPAGAKTATKLVVSFNEDLHTETLALDDSGSATAKAAKILSYFKLDDSNNGTGGSKAAVDLLASRVHAIAFEGKRTLNITLAQNITLTKDEYVLLKFVAKAVKDTTGNAIAATTIVAKKIIEKPLSTAQKAALKGISDNPSTSTKKNYDDLGVTGVTNTNLAAVRTAVAAITKTNRSPVTIQAAVNKIVALAKIGAHAGRSSNGSDGTVPTKADYTAAGVNKVTDDNLTAVNNAVLAKTASTNADETSEIQAIVDTVVAAITKISGYAGNKSAATGVPAKTDYDLVGYDIASLTGGNAAADLATANAVIHNATANAAAANSVTKIKALLTAGKTALTKINTHAKLSVAGNAETIPTVNDYKAAGATGVVTANLDAVNAIILALGDGSDTADTTAEIQTEVDKVIALAKIATYAEATNKATAAPTTADFTAAGVDLSNIVGGDAAAKLAVAKDIIYNVPAASTNADTTAEIQGLIDAAITALAKIDDYADDNTNTAPVKGDFDAAGVTNVVAGNIEAVKKLIDALSANGADTPAKIQAEVAKVVAALTKINTHAKRDAAAGGGADPVVNDYTAAGVTGVVSANLGAVNAIILALGNTGNPADTTAEIQTEVDKVTTALTKINTHARRTTAGAANTIPTVNDYTAAGAKGVVTANLDAVNAIILALGNGSDTADTTAKIQTEVDKVVAALTKIATYAEANSKTTAAPTTADFTAAGVDLSNIVGGDAAAKLAVAKDIIYNVPAASTNADTTAEIQGLIDAAITALAKIQAYATDSTSNPAPVYNDYIAAGVVMSGVTGVDNAAKTTTANTAVDAVGVGAADTPAEIQALL